MSRLVVEFWKCEGVNVHPPQEEVGVGIRPHLRRYASPHTSTLRQTASRLELSVEGVRSSAKHRSSGPSPPVSVGNKTDRNSNGISEKLRSFSRHNGRDFHVII